MILVQRSYEASTSVALQEVVIVLYLNSVGLIVLGILGSSKYI